MRRQLLAVLVLFALLGGVAPAAAAPKKAAPAPEAPVAGMPDLDTVDPERFSYDDAVTEHAQVTTRNGLDQMWVDIIRPDTDEAVPTILISSPYYNTLGRGWRGELKTPHQGPGIPTSPGFPLLSGGAQADFPEWYDEYFVPRGYAVALMDLRGTRNSSGCQVYGDRAEVFDTVDVIDWIADQGWSNGKVGMTGGSYDGTLAIGAAAEQPMSGRHPNALAAIIPIRAIDRWYDYHFFNGVQSQGHAATPALFTAALAAGDTQNSGTDDPLLPLHFVERKACIPTFGAMVNAGYASPYQDARAPFWRQRDYTRSAPGFRAATFIMHGLFDYNVKSNNAGYLWDALPDHLPKKLWLYNGAHTDPHLPEATSTHPFAFQNKFVDATHRWYAQYLKGVDAGAESLPDVEVQGADGAWTTSQSFPASTGDLQLWLAPDGTAGTEPAEEGSVAYRDAATGRAPSSVTFVTEPMGSDTRLSGQFGFDLDLTAEGPDTTVAVTVLDVPPGAQPGDSSTTLMTADRTRPLVVSYAWLRGWYRDSVPLRGLSTPTGGGPMEPGTGYDVTFGSLYTDLVVPEGHRLAFRFSNNAGGTVPALTGGTVELGTGADASRVLVPVVEESAEATPPPSSDKGRPDKAPPRGRR